MTANTKKDLIPLSSLKENEGGVIDHLGTVPAVTQRLVEMGITPGEYVRFVRKAPFGDPIEIELLNYRLAIRKSEARKIYLRSAKKHIVC